MRTHLWRQTPAHETCYQRGECVHVSGRHRYDCSRHTRQVLMVWWKIFVVVIQQSTAYILEMMKLLSVIYLSFVNVIDNMKGEKKPGFKSRSIENSSISSTYHFIQNDNNIIYYISCAIVDDHCSSTVGWLHACWIAPAVGFRSWWLLLTWKGNSISPETREGESILIHWELNCSHLAAWDSLKLAWLETNKVQLSVRAVAPYLA